MGASCTNRIQQGGKNHELSHFRQRYAVQGNNCLRLFAIDNETWIHNFTPTIKQSTMEWKHSGSPRKRDSKVTPSAGKVLAAVCWDSSGVLLVTFWNVDAQLTPKSTAPS
jgi:hypothetical protein